MTQEADAGRVEADDYEYDLAHEATGDLRTDQPAPAPPPPPHRPAADAGGDYGYDSAHDWS